jgi:hypothetical protein
VRHDIGDSCSLDYLIDSIFPLFRKHIEPDLHHAQARYLIFSLFARFLLCAYLMKNSLNQAVTAGNTQQ